MSLFRAKLQVLTSGMLQACEVQHGSGASKASKVNIGSSACEASTKVLLRAKSLGGPWWWSEDMACGVKTRSLEQLKWHFGRKLHDLSSTDDLVRRECTASVDPMKAQGRVTFFRREDSDPPDDPVRGVRQMIRCYRRC